MKQAWHNMSRHNSNLIMAIEAYDSLESISFMINWVNFSPPWWGPRCFKSILLSPPWQRLKSFRSLWWSSKGNQFLKLSPHSNRVHLYSVKSAIKSTKYSVNTILRNPQLQCKRYEYEINISRRIISRCLGVELQDELCWQRWQKLYCVALQCSRKRYTTSLPRSIQNPISLANG